MYMENALRVQLMKVLPEIQNSILHEGRYFGIPMWKFPGDATEILNIIFMVRPTVIIELGTKYGGFTLMMAHYLDQLYQGKILSVDIDHTKVGKSVLEHGRITLFTGDAELLFDTISSLISPEDIVLVLEDTSHKEDHVMRLLQKYSPLVTPGSYYIVEDSIINNGLERSHPGPMPAIIKFLSENKEFESVREHEKFVITWNPRGYLRKKRDLH